MHNKTTNSSCQCTQHKALRTAPHTTSYTWHQLACPSPNLRGQGHLTPRSRYKHVACLHGDCIYVYGGRDGGVCHRDLWRYSLKDNAWEQLNCTGDQPMSPQDHTMLAYQNNLYIFGGQFCSSYDQDAPIWILELKTLMWRRGHVQTEVVTPSGRRGHTAVIHQRTMYIYGGYVDLKGSSNELWMFDLDIEMWHLKHEVMQNNCRPDGRHGHSAVVYDDAMFVYGGMANLVDKDDLWKYDFSSCQWMRIKSHPSPPALKGHSACVIADQMLVYGGISQGSILNTLWCFHFGPNTWCRLTAAGVSVLPSVYHTAVVVMAVDTEHAQGRSLSYPLLQDGQNAASYPESRPYSSPANLQTVHAYDTQESHFVFKNKVLPSGSPQHRDDRASITPAPSSVATRSVKNALVTFQDDSQEGSTAGSVPVDMKFDDSLQPRDTDDCKCQCHLTPANNNVARKHKFDTKSEIEIKSNVTLENAANTNQVLSKNESGESDFTKILSNPPTRSLFANDLTLEDIENDEEISSFSLAAVTSQYLLNDSLSSSTDILNLSNGSETTELITSHQPKIPHCAQIRCLSPKAWSSESLAYGLINPLFDDQGPPEKDLHEHNSSMIDISPSCHCNIKEQCSRGIFNQYYQMDYAESADRINSADNSFIFAHVQKQTINASKKNATSLRERFTEFSNPCYVYNGNVPQEIEMQDFAPRLPSGGSRKEKQSCSQELLTSDQQWTAHEDSCTAKVVKAKKDLKDSVQKSVTKRAAPMVLTPPVPLSQEPRPYYMYILGGQTTQSKRFGYNPLNSWRLTVILDKK